MTKIKFCGLTRPEDIEISNQLKPEYIGFVFAEKSKRYVTPKTAAELKKLLSPEIRAVGVFVNDSPEFIAGLLNNGIIDIAQLHGGEDNEYIKRLRKLTEKPIIKAFYIETEKDINYAKGSDADYVLLDSGAGTGRVFDWELIKNIKRPYFLAGGLSPYNVHKAIETLNPFAVDVSSGIEKNGKKDIEKMTAFISAVRKEYNL